jgi:hypothetical protein
MDSTLAAVVVLAVLFVTGAPIAYGLSRDHGDWVRFTFESLSIGLLAQVLIGIVALRSHHYSRALLALMTLAVIVGGVIVAWRRGMRGVPRLDLTLSLIVVALVALALVLRRYPSYFAFSVGDMGGYVNSANAMMDGRYVGNRPQGFTVFLAGTNALLGAAGTVSGLPAIGIMLLLGTVSIGKLIGLRTAAVAVIGAIVVVHPITVWFSLFPVSEVLYAVMLLAAVYFLVRARADPSPFYAVLCGLMLGATMFVRINAMILAPLLVVVLLASAAADDDVRYRMQRHMTVVALAVLSLGYLYDVRYARRYMIVQMQGKVVPKFAFETATDLKLFDISAQLVLGLAALFALVLVAAYYVRGKRPPRIPLPGESFWKAAAATVVGLTVVGFLLAQRGGIQSAVVRWGPVLIVLALAGLGLLVLRPGRYFDSATGLFVILSVAAFSLLFAMRLRHARGAIYFLYWDRYLYSEVLPLALVLGAITVHALLGLSVEQPARRPLLRAAAAVGLVVIVVVGLVPAALQTRNTGISREALYGDSYDKLRELDRLTRTDGVGPIIYSGVRPKPDGWFFPNTKSAIARPLKQSFGRVLVATRFGRDTLDRIFTPRSARKALAAAGSRRGYLIQLRPAFSERRYRDDKHTRYVGSVDYEVPILRRSLHPWSERFTHVNLHFDVYALQ